MKTQKKMNNALTLDQVYKARYALKDVAIQTDILYAPKLKSGCELYLKTENLQITGSFKVRGAYYKMSQLTPEEKQALLGTLMPCSLEGRNGVQIGHRP